MPIAPVLRRLRHEDQEFESTSRANLRPCLQNQAKKGGKRNKTKKKQLRKKTKYTILMQSGHVGWLCEH